jgi:hypothetical protein
MTRFTLVFGILILLSANVFSQTEGITYNPYEAEEPPLPTDTIGVTYYDWELFVFGAYFAQECEENLHDADSIIEVQEDKMKYMQTQLTLKENQKDTLKLIIVEKDGIIERGEKREKRKRLENGILKGAGGTSIAVLVGLYLWKELTD